MFLLAFGCYVLVAGPVQHLFSQSKRNAPIVLENLHLFIMAEKIASPLSERAIFIAQVLSSHSLAALYTASVLSSIHSHIHAAVTATMYL